MLWIEVRRLKYLFTVYMKLYAIIVFLYDIHETFSGQKFGVCTLIDLLPVMVFQFMQILPDVSF